MGTTTLSSSNNFKATLPRTPRSDTVTGAEARRSGAECLTAIQRGWCALRASTMGAHFAVAIRL